MLEGLDAVPWDTIEHCYGKATDVPDLIRAVASPDKAARDSAWHDLYGNLWHQGTIFEATAHAVPFFIELVQHRSVPDRDWILGYLVSLATGTSFHDVHQSLDIFAERRGTPEFHEQRQKELGWVDATRDAVRRGRHVYARLLDDGVARVRVAAAHLLGLFPRDAAQHIRWLQARIATGEPDEQARALSVLTVGRLAKHVGGVNEWLENMFDADRSEAVRVAAALGLAWTRGRDLPPAARHLIHINAMNPSPVAAIFENLPWGCRDRMMQYYCQEALGFIRDPNDDSIATLVAAMNEVAPRQSREIARQLLTRVFGGAPMPPTTRADQLTADQRAVLSAIVVSDRLWHNLNGRVHVPSTMNLMKECALPQNVLNLRAFLEGRLTPQDPEWSQRFLERELTPEQLELRRRLLQGAADLKTTLIQRDANQTPPATDGPASKSYSDESD